MRFGAQGECSVTELERLKDLKGQNFSSLSPKLTENGKKGTRTEKVTKPSPQALVKGKKALAWSRATTNPIDKSIGSPEFQAANNPQPLLFTATPNRAAPNGRSVQEASTKAQATTYKESKNGGEGSVDGVRRDPCTSDLGLGLI